MKEPPINPIIPPKRETIRSFRLHVTPGEANWIKGANKTPLPIRLFVWVLTGLVTPFALLQTFLVLDWLIPCPWDRYGNLHIAWLQSGLPGMIYLLGLIVSIVWAFKYLRRKWANYEGSSSEVQSPKGRLREGQKLLLFHLLVTAMGVFVFFSAFAGELEAGLYFFAGDQRRHVANDLGAKRRSPGRRWVEARNITDRGLAAIAAHGENKSLLWIFDSPSISSDALRLFSKMPNLGYIRFHASGQQQEWGGRRIESHV